MIFQDYLDVQQDGEVVENILCEFLQVEDFNETELNYDDQCIIMIAANFRKEVTSTVLWLLEHNIKIKCVKVTPYELNGQILLDTEQIIPIKDAEEYVIKVANKKQEEVKIKEQNQARYNIRRDFWTSLLKEMNKKSQLFSNVNLTKDNWLGTVSGYSGIAYTFTATGGYARVELWINRGSQDENKTIFDKLFANKEKIETKFEAELDWQRLDDGKGSRISYSLTNVSIFNEEHWTEMIQFLTDHMIQFESSMKDPLYKVMNDS